ncbi:class I SAM-dependent methyltransferase [Cellulomonas composti]|uniref:16S RNA G1207 methylase RsmC n=1 Tax=Cellulomonas composti TaxID=266130 RepID=A0A511J8E9_9CELL|nr:methyltransferase [Cellulomonas composti]GEL94272.1 16S RNA G1207 methylase RsmC [Cellulomonas composti]
MGDVEHYFTAQPATSDERRTIAVHLAGRELRLETAGGVFSPDHVDHATAILLDEVPAPPASGDLLDLGCGWGPIALSLALLSPDASVWAVDVNERALDLTRRNAAAAAVEVQAVLPDDVPAHVRFAAIWSNPPIRVGKAALHELLLRWLPRLAPGGAAYLVVGRNLGADSLQRWLVDELVPMVLPGAAVDRVTSARGFRVLRVLAPPDGPAT